MTAQRREALNKDLPIAIAAFDPQMLEQAGVENSRDLQSVAPGLRMNSSARLRTARHDSRGSNEILFLSGN